MSKISLSMLMVGAEQSVSQSVSQLEEYRERAEFMVKKWLVLKVKLSKKKNSSKAEEVKMKRDQSLVHGKHNPWTKSTMIPVGLPLWRCQSHLTG
jgi:hypothetical protein